MKARILVFLGVWVVIGLVVFSIPGCYGRNCEATFATFGVDAGQGEMISENEWESNAQDGEWLYFPRQRSYLFNITAWGGRTPFQVIPYLSAHKFQNEDGANDIIGAGNIAEQSAVGPNAVTMVNDTCSDYYLRLTVNLYPFPPVAPTTTATTTPVPTTTATTSP
jgi:hypothetical protein